VAFRAPARPVHVMNVLVVGASGFIGRALDRLLRERDVATTKLSRSATSDAGWVQGDVRHPNLDLEPAVFARLTQEVTHIVSCFGSVDWRMGPRLATDLHLLGTKNLLAFAGHCRQLERLVHVSSVLVLGRSSAIGIRNRQLHVGQQFRSWYEYGKFLAEREVRETEEIPRRIVRFGPLLGTAEGAAPSTDSGLTSLVPYVLRGYPVVLKDGGRFPCYVGEVNAAADLLFMALTDTGQNAIWTWFDDRRPSLAEVLAGLCEPWNVVPRIVAGDRLPYSTRFLTRRLGLPVPLLGYTEPWVDLDDTILDDLPSNYPRCPEGYIAATGTRMKATTPMVGAF
jgi:nucleoside-diphosphate-sugar epimerase